MKPSTRVRAALVSAAIMLAAALWAANKIDVSHTDVPALMPDGALLFLQSKDFAGLLKDWNESAEKRAWLEGGNYQAFSRSRLYLRLSQAQDEFSAAAGVTTGNSLLSSIAGEQSGLALYDIGALEFVYVTRMDESKAEATPLWQIRDKFELRKEGQADFYMHQDPQSKRTAAFAIRAGWLVLGTRADLVAGVLDRLQGTQAHSMPDEPWYADSLKHATGPVDDLRMVLNLQKIVPSPYFRSYWVQRNISEMKQYRSALSDLHRTANAYREDRVLLRIAPIAETPATAVTPTPSEPSGDVQVLSALAPEDVVFYSVQAAPQPDHMLNEMRENLLDLKPTQEQSSGTAPAAATTTNAGDPAMLEERIDVAPVIAAQADPYTALRNLLSEAHPTALVEVYATSALPDATFAGIDKAIVIQSPQPWSQAAAERSLITALRPTLTASQLGLGWVLRASPKLDSSAPASPKQASSTPQADATTYFALSGEVPFYLAIRDKLLFVSSSDMLIEHMLTRNAKRGAQPDSNALKGATYAAVFHHTAQERSNFMTIATHLDRVGQPNRAPLPDESTGDASSEKRPGFFSGNIASLSHMLSTVTEESVIEKDEGAQVIQTVTYQRQHP